MYQNDPMKCLTGEVRLSYVHLTQPYANAKTPGAEPKYSATILIPKTDVATKADLDRAFEAAAQDAVAKKWGGFRPPQLKSVIHDGDGVRQDGTPFGEECKGHWVLTASSKQPPQVVGMDNINCQLAPQDIYSGMYARVTLRFFGYANSGNKGVGCGLGNVLKTRDGEPLSGGASAAADFAGIGQPGIPDAQAPAYPNAPAQGYPAQAPAYPNVQNPAFAAPAQTPAQTPVDPITGMPVTGLPW